MPDLRCALGHVRLRYRARPYCRPRQTRSFDMPGEVIFPPIYVPGPLEDISTMGDSKRPLSGALSGQDELEHSRLLKFFGTGVTISPECSGMSARRASVGLNCIGSFVSHDVPR
jgi:hypothetical protein